MGEHLIPSEASFEDLGAAAAFLAQLRIGAHLNSKCLWWYDEYFTINQVFPGDPHGFTIYETGALRVNQGATDDV